MQGEDTYEEDDEAFISELSKMYLKQLRDVWGIGWNNVHILLPVLVCLLFLCWDTALVHVFVHTYVHLFMCGCVFVRDFTEKMWRYDEELLVAMEQKHKMLMEEVERLEKENQKVIIIIIYLICDCAFNLNFTHSARHQVCNRGQSWHWAHEMTSKRIPIPW